MADQEALFSAVLSCSYRLPHEIPAIQALRGQNGGLELAAISHLPGGAELTFCGDGFNESTLKVCFEGQFFFVFIQDVISAPQPNSSDARHILRKSSNSQRRKPLAASHVA